MDSRIRCHRLDTAEVLLSSINRNGPGCRYCLLYSFLLRPKWTAVTGLPHLSYYRPGAPAEAQRHIPVCADSFREIA